MLFLFLCWTIAALSTASVDPPDGDGWVPTNGQGKIDFGHDLQTTPLQMVTDSARNKLEINLQDGSKELVVRLWVYLSDVPPTYKMMGDKDKSEFQPNPNLESNKIWEIQRIKADNSLEIYYDGERIAKPQLHSDLGSFWENDVKNIRFQEDFNSAPSYYRPKPVFCDELKAPDNAQATHSGQVKLGTVVTVTCKKPQLYAFSVTCQLADDGTGEWSMTPKCLDNRL